MIIAAIVGDMTIAMIGGAMIIVVTADVTTTAGIIDGMTVVVITAAIAALSRQPTGQRVIVATAVDMNGAGAALNVMRTAISALSTWTVFHYNPGYDPIGVVRGEFRV